MTVRLSPRGATRLIFLAIAALVECAIAVKLLRFLWRYDVVPGLARQVTLNMEGNAATWFSSTLLLVASALLFLSARLARAGDGRYVGHWNFLCLVFTYLAMDETAMIHEAASAPVRDALHVGGFLFLAWVIPAGALTAAIGLAYLRFLAHLDPLSRRRFVIAGAVFVGGAIGMEMVGAAILTSGLGHASLPYAAEVIAEETMEMLGVALFIRALLLRLEATHGEIALRLSASGATRLILPVMAALVACAVAALVQRVGFNRDTLFGLARLVDLNGEENVSAWFSSALLFVASALLLVSARLARDGGGPFVRHWMFLCLAFLFLSLDETAQIHETAAWPIKRLLPLEGRLQFTWVIPFAAVTGAIGLAYLRFLAHLDPSSRRRFIFAGAVYVGGAIGMELVGDALVRSSGGQAGGSFAAAAIVEETMEMLGVALFIRAILLRLEAKYGEVTLQLADGPPEATPSSSPPSGGSPP